MKSKNLFTKGEEANIVSNVNNNKGINNYEPVSINQKECEKIYMPMESSLLKETSDHTNYKNGGNVKSDSNNNNNNNNNNSSSCSNNNICIMQNEYLGNDRYDNKYYYLADIFGYINRIYVLYNNNKNIINDENKKLHTEHNNNNNNNNNNCCNISVEIMNSFVFCPIHQNANTTKLSKYNINIGYIEGIQNIDLFINNFDTSIYNETNLKKKFIQIKEIIHNEQFKVLKKNFKKEKCVILKKKSTTKIIIVMI